MAESTQIEWADSTFNLWEGCTKISPACDFCYAAERAKRFGSVEWGGPRRLMSKATRKRPHKWQREAEAFYIKHGRRRRVFCSSLSDVFDNQVPDEWREELWDIIRATPGLDWLLLTKRPQNIEKMLPPFWDEIKGHIWLGTTVENQEVADRNIPYLLKHDCAVRFLSIEPMLGLIDIEPWIGDKMTDPCETCEGACDDCPALKSIWTEKVIGVDSDGFKKISHYRETIDWVIAGGESGPNARPSDPQWFKWLRDQCIRFGTPFLFKQHGEWFPYGEIDALGNVNSMTKGETPDVWKEWDRHYSVRIGKKLAGRFLDGITHDGFPTPRV